MAAQILNIAFVSTVYLGGGAEQVMFRTAQSLIEKGHKVKFFILEKFESTYKPPNIELHFLRLQRGKGIKRLLQYKKNSKLLEQEITKSFNSENFLLVSHMPDTDRYTKFIDAKKFSVVHGILDPWQEKRPLLSRLFKNYKLKRRYNNAHLICVSKFIADNIIKTIRPSNATIDVIYNPFPIKTIRTLSEEAIKVEIPKNYFLFAGRISQEKRLDLVLTAFAKSKTDHHLVVMGTGESNELEKMRSLAQNLNIEDRLHLIGYQKNPYSLMKGATALLLCSEFEGFGNVILESLLTGTPALVLECPGGPREILQGELNQYLVDRNNFDGFVAKMEEISLNKSRISEQIDFSKFDSAVSAKSYEKVLLNL